MPANQEYQAFAKIAEKATELQQMDAIQNAQESEDCDEFGTEEQQANFWNIARITLAIELDANS